MFQRHFGLERDPFSISPDPAFLYPSEQHRQALAHLKYGLEREGGFILLTGEVGTGKTTLTRLLLEQAPANFRIAYILNARLGVEDLLASICQELDVTQLGADAGHREMVDQLYRNLLQAHEQGRRTLVVIEEAQNLSAEVLETLRLLTNLETNTAKLLHILLVGQPELLDTLSLPALRQLDQRVVSRHHLQPLRAEDVGHYVAHRMKAAGASRPVFQPGAIRELKRRSGGIPRKINLLAERALMGSFASELNQVSHKQVANAAAEVFAAAPPTKRPAGTIWFAAGALALVVAAVLFYLSGPADRPDLQPGIAVEPQPAPQMQPQIAEPAAAVDDAEVVEEPLPVQQTDSFAQPEAAVSPPESSPLSPFSQLLSLWSVQADAGSVAELCRLAAAHQLRCVELSQQSQQEAAQINRPLLVLGSSIETGLMSAASQLQETSWPADILYLWRPPAGYDDSIWPGDRNSAVVSWLLPQLATLSEDAPHLITGGNYTRAVADLVAEFQQREGLVADGVLGQNTLMRLNELQAGMVPTLRTVSN